MIWSSSSTSPLCQVTPTAPNASTGCGVLTTRASVAPPATVRPRRPAKPPAAPVRGTSVTFGVTALVGTVADISAAGAAGTAVGATGRLPHDVEGHDTGGGGEHDEHDTEGQHLLAEGDEAGLKRTHDKTPAVWGKVTQGRSFTPVTSVTEGFLSNYKRVISSRHAVTSV